MKIKVGSNNVTIRKWKAKEKKAFLSTIKKGEPIDNLQDVLVYNCIEEDVVFNADEFKYAMTKIREYSIGEEITLEFYCNCCKSKFTETINLKEVVKPVYSNKKIIKTKNYEIKLSNIRNVDFYKKTLKENPSEEKDYDFYLRIGSINDNDCMSLDEIIQLFNEMDIDEFDSIFEQWEDIRFKINDTKQINCKKCNDAVIYSFDEIPGFFPTSWFK